MTRRDVLTRGAAACLAPGFAGAARRSPTVKAPVTALAFSPDGALLVSGGYGSLTIRSTPDGKTVRSVVCRLRRVLDVAFSPDATLMVAAGGTSGERGQLEFFDWPVCRSRWSAGSHVDVVTAVSFSPDGRWLATASADRTAQLFPAPARSGQLDDGQPLRGHTAPVLAAGFSPDGSVLVTASADRSLRVWERATGKLMRRLEGHIDAVHAVAFRPPTAAPAVSTCASAGSDRTMRVWQPDSGRMIRTVRGHGGPVLSAAYSRDGAWLYSAGTEGLARAIDAESDRIAAEWRMADGWIHTLAVSPNGEWLATGDAAGEVRTRRLENRTGDGAPSMAEE